MFSCDKNDLGHVDPSFGVHRINVGGIPPYMKPSRLAQAEHEEALKIVSDLKSSGVVEPADSEYNAAIVMVEVSPEDRHKTAFSVNGQWVRMPMGLCNSVATFQR
ncbi:unnamed protein product [Vitrella brassicaformis CCMP3155]|uniref:Reverse transcriptase domain-containing protein n=1 Tax=Vitrella brassicaformis (strain CCMP3155) TaxID=1169540 RepID=A0A0G4GNB4_VITBC|nr:unnamed protein product [Vitrella brassicaformis CCMP3155]|eukprot:CEM31693.1 unnamed protein product [Vitrella brassicaformis CCMP3155]